MRKWLVLALLAGCGRHAPERVQKSVSQEAFEQYKCRVTRIVDDRVSCRFCQADGEWVDRMLRSDFKRFSWLDEYFGGAKALSAGVEVCETH